MHTHDFTYAVIYLPQALASLQKIVKQQQKLTKRINLETSLSLPIFQALRHLFQISVGNRHNVQKKRKLHLRGKVRFTNEYDKD